MGVYGRTKGGDGEMMMMMGTGGARGDGTRAAARECCRVLGATLKYQRVRDPSLNAPLECRTPTAHTPYCDVTILYYPSPLPLSFQPPFPLSSDN